MEMGKFLVMNNLIRSSVLHKGEVGIEIECCFDSYDAVATTVVDSIPSWKLEEDGSLRWANKCGVELVLKKPVIRDDVNSVLNEVDRYFRKFKVVESPSAGIHIHINIQDMEVIHVINMICLSILFEESLLKFSGPTRINNLFCKKINTHIGLIFSVSECINFGSFDLLNRVMSNNRYCFMNILPLLQYGSVEYRSLRSTKDMEVIKTWIKLLLKIKDFSIKFKTPLDLADFISNTEHSEIVEKCFEEMEGVINQYDTLDSIERGELNCLNICHSSDWVSDLDIFKNNRTIFFDAS